MEIQENLRRMGVHEYFEKTTLAEIRLKLGLEKDEELKEFLLISFSDEFWDIQWEETSSLTVRHQKREREKDVFEYFENVSLAELREKLIIVKADDDLKESLIDYHQTKLDDLQQFEITNMERTK